MSSEKVSPPKYATFDEWIGNEAIPFSLDSSTALNTAVDTLMSVLGPSVELLGFGEALHGGEDLLLLRNRLFQRLASTHGYTAIAVESSLPRGRIVDEYVAGRGPASYEDVQDTGFSHGFGRLAANRELVEWMRQSNAGPARTAKLRFYGFDTPTEMMGSDSPRQTLHFVLDYLASVDRSAARRHRDRIYPLLGEDAAWESAEAMLDPSKSVGLSPQADALRIATEDLIAELHLHRPGYVAQRGEDSYRAAVHDATVARELLNYHAAVARAPDDRFARLLGMRDASMAHNLAYIVSRERGRGKVLAFAHNSHLQRGPARWQLGDDLHTWWPAGAHLDVLFGPRYAVIGSAVGASQQNAIGESEPGTLEAYLADVHEPALFIPTHCGQAVPSAADELRVRTGSARNTSYFPLTPQSFTDFDCFAFLASTTYIRGGPPLP